MTWRLGASLFSVLILAGCVASASPVPSSSPSGEALLPASSPPPPPSSSPVPSPAPSPSDEPAAIGSPDPAYVALLHRQAEAALARWSTAVEAAGVGAVVLLDELTWQEGSEPNETLAGDIKDALMCGLLEPAVNLPPATPPPGEVRWPDRTARTVQLISAQQAIVEIRAAITPDCHDRRPLQVTAARLTAGAVQTSRGPATAPLWEFSLRGTAVRVTRIAVADRVRLDPPDGGQGLRIESASTRAGTRELTVSFVGSPSPAGVLCGADYTAEAIESSLAVVVIVSSHQHPLASPLPSGVDVACALIGAERTASVTLASPLGDRTVLEVTQGLPVPTRVSG